MTKQFTFKLREDSPPHLYIDSIKKIVEKDGYLHPTMKKLLLLMKKTHLKYIILGKVREVIIVKERKGLIEKQYYILERSIIPLTGYNITYISKDSIDKIKINENSYYRELITFYNELGYNAIEEKDIDDNKLLNIIKLVKFPKEER